MTIETIGRAAGASVGSMYHHFGSKEGVLAALYQQLLSDYREAMAETLAAASDAETLIKAFVRQHLHWIAAHPEQSRFLFSMRHSAQLADEEDALRAGTARFVAEIKRYLQAAVEAGELRRLPWPLYVSILAAPVHQLGRDWLSGKVAELDIVDAAELLADAAWRALRS